MNEIDFSTLATQCSIFPDRRSKEQAIRTHAAIKARWKKKTTTTTATSQNTGLNTSTDSGALSCKHSGAPWVIKFGHLCNQEIFVVTKLFVGTYVHLLMLANAKCHVLTWSPRYTPDCKNVVA